MGIPVMLGSKQAIWLGAVSALLIVRTALEDQTLQSELPGYREYTQRTHYRLLLGVW